ncbi:MAG: hypothetical protein JWO82_2471 [Akkermansiaceae bacterium]|nr:hypothetical protein [Akkermansiaceae bacterium]
MSKPRPNFFVCLMDWSGVAFMIFMAASFPFVTACLFENWHHYRNVEQWIEIPAEVSIRNVDHSVESYSKNLGCYIRHETWTSADYTYAVNGIHYRGQAVSAHGPVLHTSLPEHPPTVFYNPADPADAVVVREPLEAKMETLLLGLCLAALLWAMCSWIKDLRKRRRHKAVLTPTPARPAK